MVLQCEAVDEQTGGDEDLARPDRLEADFGFGVAAIEASAFVANNVIDDPASGQLAKAAADKESKAVAETDVESVPAEEVGEDDGHGHRGEHGREAVLGRVVEGWEDNGGVFGHLDRGEDELACLDGELRVIGP